MGHKIYFNGEIWLIIPVLPYYLEHCKKEFQFSEEIHLPLKPLSSVSNRTYSVSEQRYHFEMQAVIMQSIRTLFDSRSLIIFVNKC